MKPVEIAPDIFWVGALDPQLRRFDILLAAEQGTTYNAYLVKGKEKAALVELVKAPFTEDLLANLRSVINLSDISYVILNHTEPDHSGALGRFLEEAPQAQVVAGRAAKQFLPALLNREVNPRLVQEGETIDLGGRQLSFIEAPFLHWPDSMLTYLAPEKILFTCDFLGCHYCDDRLFDDRVGDFSYAYRYYFDHIFRPFKSYVLKALDKLEGKEISVAATGHGPILRRDVKQYLDLYRQWSTPAPKTQKTLAVFYASAYGNTARMAQEIAAGAEAEGVKAGLYDIVATDPGYAVDAVEQADGLVIGSPTINGDAVKPAWDLLSSLATIKIRGKVGAAFGSFAWSGEAPRLLEERLKGLKLKIPASAPQVSLVPTEEDLAACREFGAALARAVKGEEKS